MDPSQADNQPQAQPIPQQPEQSPPPPHVTSGGGGESANRERDFFDYIQAAVTDPQLPQEVEIRRQLIRTVIIVVCLIPCIW
eukprot:CAMPEP_0117438304 /NCGR_PEP_ID=MMETSP0759-20121206/1984_1 /TAXON_ID=63605 /ORGANISM="Percolomonas cosmopolitus, Strain WS" /LENGTH=81 /DNA_ID=CAMNT_0005229991 /DNA_START=20 /DNA_END=262 /DNA_ORIENTATION=+